MKKITKAAALLLIFVLAFNLAACGEKKETANTNESGKEETVNSDEKGSEVVTDPVDTEVVDDDTEAASNDSRLISIGISNDSDYTFDDDSYAQVAYMNYETISVLNPGSKYQALAEKVNEFSKENLNGITEEYEGMQKAVDEVSESESLYLPYYTTMDYSVLRADDKALSVLIKRVSITGGANPNNGVNSAIFDSVTGSRLALADVISDKAAFVALVKEQAVNNAGEDIIDPEEYINGAFDANTLTWVLTYNGVDVYFSPYEIASYAAGYIIASVSFTEHPEVFNAKYMDVPGKYTCWLAADSNIAVDTDGDGISDKLQFWNTFDPELVDETSELVVMRNGESFISDSDFPNFEYNLQVINTGDRSYLVVDGMSYNSYHEMKVYDLKTGKQTDVLSGLGINYFSGNDGYLQVWQATCDPELITLSERVDALSTAFVSRDYTLNEGKFNAVSKIRKYDKYQPVVKNAVGLELSTCDEEGNETGSITVKPGETFTYKYTDNESFVIAALSDGTLVKLNMDISDWPQLVEGQDIEDVFPDAAFAG